MKWGSAFWFGNLVLLFLYEIRNERQFRVCLPELLVGVTVKVLIVIVNLLLN